MWLPIFGRPERRLNAQGENLHRRRTDEDPDYARVSRDLAEAQRRIENVKRQLRVMRRRDGI